MRFLLDRSISCYYATTCAVFILSCIWHIGTVGYVKCSQKAKIQTQRQPRTTHQTNGNYKRSQEQTQPQTIKTTIMGAKSALDQLEGLIADLEAKLNLAPGAEPVVAAVTKQQQHGNQNQKKKEKKQAAKQNAGKARGGAPADPNLPDICKLEFKVGIITKAWVHPDADRLYCEEIDCGEECGPRQIASGLRAHYNLDEMQGQRLLVVANLKAKNLVGFKSHGMVLCAAETNADGTEKVEFVEPPEGAPLGEIVTFEGLPTPAPFTPSQVEKKKLFAACMDGMKTNDQCQGTFNGAVFMTTAGACKAKSIKGGNMR